MELTNFLLIFSLAFGLGMLHALDADHVMAVSSLITSQSDKRRSIRFCFRWAIGHGATLVLLGVIIFFLGYQLPESVSTYAEIVVGLMLVTIGCILIAGLFKRKVHLHFHRHDGLPDHAHWHSHENKVPADQQKISHHHDHAAVLVGVLHGLAGSAPLMALIPVSMMGSPLHGFIYLLVFSLGVFCAMLVFGGLFGQLMKITHKQGDNAVKTLRIITGTGSIVLGAFVIRSVLP